MKNMPLASQVGKLETWQAEALMQRLDDNASGFVTYEEFEEFMQPPRSRAMLQEDLWAKVQITSERTRAAPTPSPPPPTTMTTPPPPPPPQLAEPSFGNSCRTLVKKLDPDGNGVLSKGEIHTGLEKVSTSVVVA